MRYSTLKNLNIDVLMDLYEREFQELKTALINGTDWNEVHDQRQKVSRIAISIHQKLNSRNSLEPSAHAARDH